MIGVGKGSVNLMEYRYKFASALGLDNKSWGYSHRGRHLFLRISLLYLLYKIFRFANLMSQNINYYNFFYLTFAGMIQHKNILKYYGKPFSKGCIVGVYLDLSLGTLEFYLNRMYVIIKRRIFIFFNSHVVFHHLVHKVLLIGIY